MSSRMGRDLDTLRAMTLSRFVTYLLAVGALAGLFSWLLAFGAHLLFDIPRPSWISLCWAAVRGGLFAVVLGIALRWYWNRRAGPD